MPDIYLKKRKKIFKATISGSNYGKVGASAQHVCVTLVHSLCKNNFYKRK